MGPLLPTRMAPTVLPAAAAHFCWSLSTVLTAVVARRVIRVTPGSARWGEELVESRGGCRLRVSHVIPLIAVRCSRCWLLLLGWLPPYRLGLRSAARRVHAVALALVRASVPERTVAVVLVVREAVIVGVGLIGVHHAARQRACPRCSCHARALLSAMLMKRGPAVVLRVAIGSGLKPGRVMVYHPGVVVPLRSGVLILIIVHPRRIHVAVFHLRLPSSSPSISHIGPVLQFPASRRSALESRLLIFLLLLPRYRLLLWVSIRFFQLGNRAGVERGSAGDLSGHDPPPSPSRRVGHNQTRNIECKYNSFTTIYPCPDSSPPLAPDRIRTPPSAPFFRHSRTEFPGNEI